MATLVVLYKNPKDTAAFDKHYSERHIPLAKKIPGVKKYEISKGPVMTPAGPSGI
ncbi:MAG TPA: EthD family reductase, partial [Pseudolabrys sp.]|nr:EthD family reductase [Pseudolabrys sp.]